MNPCGRLLAHWTWTTSNGTTSINMNLLEGVASACRRTVDGGGEGEAAVERRVPLMPSAAAAAKDEFDARGRWRSWDRAIQNGFDGFHRLRPSKTD
jgi:hypothetical protein